MFSKITKMFVMLPMLLATFSVGASDSLQVISGTYKLVEVNRKKLPAVSWVGPGEECRQETLSGTMLVGSENRWAARVEERELCTKTSEEVSAGRARSAIIIGNYNVSGSKFEFHDETLGGTDYVSIDGDILRYTTAGGGDFEGQTGVYIFLEEVRISCI